MKILLLIVFIFIGFNIVANAQLCGRYSTTLIITDSKGVPIKNPGIKVVPLQNDDYSKVRTFVWENDNFGKSTVSFVEGYKIGGSYKITISAKGYLPGEREIRFPHCKNQNFDIQLNTYNLGNLSILTGRVYDPTGALIVNCKITAVNQKGEKFETYSNEEGVYSLKLPVKKITERKKRSDYIEERYDISAEMRGFRVTTIKNFVFITSQFGKMQLDIALEVEVMID